jgi:hypothetical protein
MKRSTFNKATAKINEHQPSNLENETRIPKTEKTSSIDHRGIFDFEDEIKICDIIPFMSRSLEKETERRFDDRDIKAILDLLHTPYVNTILSKNDLS